MLIHHRTRHIGIVCSIKFFAAKLICELYRPLSVPVRSPRNYIVCECFSRANFTCWTRVNIWSVLASWGHFWIWELFKFDLIPSKQTKHRNSLYDRWHGFTERPAWSMNNKIDVTLLIKMYDKLLLVFEISSRFII